MKFKTTLVLGNETYKSNADTMLDALINLKGDFDIKNPLGKVSAKGLLKAEVGGTKAELKLPPVFVKRFMFSNLMRQIMAKRLTNLLHK